MSVPSTGWYVEIDVNGHTHTPAVKGEVEKTPRVYDQPRIEIPVAQDSKWFHPAFDEAPMRVWEDGVRQPIDTLVSQREDEGATVLVGRGGSDLENRAQKEVDLAKAEDVATELIQNNSSYTANVDAFQADVQEDQVVQTADTQTELQDTLLKALEPTTPLHITGNGELESHQTAFTREGNTYDSAIGAIAFTGNDYSGATDADDNAVATVIYQTNDELVYEVTTDYTIPEEEVAVYVRDETPGDATPEVEYYLDGQLMDTLPYSDSTGRLVLGWEDVASGKYGGSGWTGGDLEPGTHTFRALVTNGTTSETEGYAIDVTSPVLDLRYSYTFDNTTTLQNGYRTLEGPQFYPDAVQRQFEDPEIVHSVPAGSASVVIDDTSGQQALELSNDLGDTFELSASNSTSVSGTFSELGPSIRLRVTLGRYGTQDTTPTQGVQPQTLDSIEVRADLDNTPLVVRRQFDGSLKDVLEQLAKETDAVWEYRRSGSTQSIEWTWPGYRTSGKTPSVARYSAERTTEGTHQKAIVKGGAQRVREESFTADHGTAVALDHQNLVVGKEVVYDASTGKQFSPTQDYQMDVQSGTITTLAKGAMTDGGTYAIDYQWRPQASHTASGVSSPRELVRDIPSLTTSRGCGQAALRLVESLSEPLESGTVTVPTAEADWSVVDQLTLDVLPTAGMQINDVLSTPGETTLRLGSRESVQEAVASIRSSIGQLQQRS